VREASEFNKSKADAERVQLETNIKKVGFGAQLLSTARDQRSYDEARAVAQANGLDVSRMPPQFDPQFIAAKLQESQTVAEQLAQQWKQKGYDLDLRKQGETERHNKRTEGINAGNLTVAQGNLKLRGEELKAPKGQFIETTNGFVLADPRDPSNVRPVMGPDGKPLKGKAADRSLNETQGKANLFGTRMKEADRILGTVEGKYSPMAVNAKMGADRLPVIGGLAGYAANTALSAEGQQAEQAQRDFINAVLRRESGAAIAESEFDNARKQYFPEPGDDKTKIDQKRRNRKLAIQGLEAEVPGGFRGAPTLTNATPVNAGGASGDFGADPLGLRK
jgi:hypothetical protein